MAPGSHHFILYKTDSDFAAAGQFNCSVAPWSHRRLLDSILGRRAAHTPDDARWRRDTGRVGQKVQFDMHYINLG